MSFNFTKIFSLTLLYTHKKAIKRTSLNKLLFFSDVFQLLKEGQVITSVKYYKMPYGPVPEYIDECRRTLIESSLLMEEETVEYNNYVFNYKSNIDDTDYEDMINRVFTESERETIQKINGRLIYWSASELSRKSHEFEPWKSAKWNEELDLTKCRRDENLIAWYKDITK